jgi:predicted phosphodiesterase
MYRHFIPQNIAPSGAKKIGVYNVNGERVYSVPLGRLAPIKKEKLYSFGLVSDIHLDKDAFYVGWQSAAKLESALSYFEDQGCAFCVQCGDLTNYGFYHKDDNGNVWLDASEFQKYDEIRKNCNIPIYGICGNHDSYGKDITNTTPVTIGTQTKTMLEWLYDFTVETDGETGTAKLSYTVERGDDLFVFVGQPRNVVPVCGENGEENLAWLTAILEANKDKRCFVFIHTYIEEDSGDPKDKRENSIFEGWAYKTAFINLIKGYPNVVLFHGHSHMKFECQEQDDKANYTEVNGFKSVHIPSLCRPRNLTETSTPYADSESQGYIVDVYDDCIVLNGMDFVNSEYVPLGVYKIDT